uniref:Phosphatidylinositol transfer protein N-terminal domain-containing protein n=1 Tax=Ciona intestinalis TaxID=7719 RepID=H2XUU3_CIOIN
MLRREYRYVLPVSMEEYKVAKQWMLSYEVYEGLEKDEGIRLLQYNNCNNNGKHEIYTLCSFDFESKIPQFVQMLLKMFFPDVEPVMHQESTVVGEKTNTVFWGPNLFKDNLRLEISSVVMEDLGTTDNAHEVPSDEWANTEVVNVDFANDPLSFKSYEEDYDVTMYASEDKTRGPYKEGWLDELKSKEKPKYVCVYKLVTCKFKWFGIDRIFREKVVYTTTQIIMEFYRKMICLFDAWGKLTIDDVYDEQNKTEL